MVEVVDVPNVTLVGESVQLKPREGDTAVVRWIVPVKP